MRKVQKLTTKKNSGGGTTILSHGFIFEAQKNLFVFD